jgi:TIR domain
MESKKGPMHTAFISYSSEDKAVAFGACKALEAGGLTCWIATRDVMSGRPYNGQISEAIRWARVFVLVLSRKSDRSRQVLWEVERAARSRLHLIAFQIEDFEPSDDLGYFLSVEHWLNAFEGVSPETHFVELLQHISPLVREGVSEARGEDTKPPPGAAPAGTEKFANYHILKHPDGTLFRLGPGAMGVSRISRFSGAASRPDREMKFFGLSAQTSAKCLAGVLLTQFAT